MRIVKTLGKPRVVTVRNGVEYMVEIIQRMRTSWAWPARDGPRWDEPARVGNISRPEYPPIICRNIAVA